MPELLDFRPPPCKSAFQRALLLAHIRGGTTYLLAQGAVPEDVEACARVVERLGARVARSADVWTVDSPGWNPQGEGSLDVGESATTGRILPGLIATLGGEHFVEARGTLRGRPLGSEIDRVLRELGADVRYAEREGCLPAAIAARAGATPLEVRIDTTHTSQGASGLMIGLARRGGRLFVEGPIGYLELTRAWLEEYGVRIECRQSGKRIEFTCDAQGLHGPETFDIPADVSAASFFVAWALGHRRRVVMRGLRVDAAPGARHPDTRFLRDIRDLGARVEGDRGDVLMLVDSGSSDARDTEQDLEEYPDSVAPWTAFLSRIPGRHVLRAAKLRHKESDRLATLARGLVACGFEARVEGDALVFEGRRPERQPGPVTVEVAGDHRMAMCFAILGSIHGLDVRVDDEACVAKSFPDFWRELERWEAWRTKGARR